jgi:hypothetical protein
MEFPASAAGSHGSCDLLVMKIDILSPRMTFSKRSAMSLIGKINVHLSIDRLIEVVYGIPNIPPSIGVRDAVQGQRGFQEHSGGVFL